MINIKNLETQINYVCVNFVWYGYIGESIFYFWVKIGNLAV